MPEGAFASAYRDAPGIGGVGGRIPAFP